MDKIHAAIAKARATRDAHPAPARPVTHGTTAPAAPRSTVQDAWDGLPVFSPSAKQMARRRIATFASASFDAGATAMDILRTKVLQQMRQNGWKRLAITSPGPHCGKSTVALNLAFSLARHADQRVIVAEMDMRRPSLAQILQAKGDASFASVLGGKIDFADVAIKPSSNVAFGLNFRPAQNTAELLQGATIGPALAKIEATYDPSLVVFDMPPMLVTDDVQAFMGQVDCVLLIAAAGATSLREIDLCESELSAQTNVLGVVLNKCRYMDKEYGYS